MSKKSITVLLAMGMAFSVLADAHNKVQLWKDGPYWAETNIGAETPWDFGYYFWWGDTIGYKRVNNVWVASDGSSSDFSFELKRTPTIDKDESSLRKEGWITTDGVLVLKHDAAYVHWGGAWRMPTCQELKDLRSRCDWKWTTTNGVNGYVVCGRSKYSSASIFLPCAGLGIGTSLRYTDSLGYYWSSVPRSEFSSYAWSAYFFLSDHDTFNYSRDHGHSVRPVQGFTK